MIPDLAVAVRRLSASQRTHPHIYCSDRTPSPDNPCAARREGPSRADGENGASLSATDATIPAAWRRGSTHPDHRMRGSNRVASPRRVGRAYLPYSDGHLMANTKRHESSVRRSRTLQPLRGGSQQRGGRIHIYIARIARQVRATLAPLAAKGRPVRTANMARHCRPRTPPFPQLGGEAAPIQIIA